MKKKKCIVSGVSRAVPLLGGGAVGRAVDQYKDDQTDAKRFASACLSNRTKSQLWQVSSEPDDDRTRCRANFEIYLSKKTALHRLNFLAWLL